MQKKHIEEQSPIVVFSQRDIGVKEQLYTFFRLWRPNIWYKFEATTPRMIRSFIAFTE